MIKWKVVYKHIQSDKKWVKKKHSMHHGKPPAAQAICKADNKNQKL